MYGCRLVMTSRRRWLKPAVVLCCCVLFTVAVLQSWLNGTKYISPGDTREIEDSHIDVDIVSHKQRLPSEFKSNQYDGTATFSPKQNLSINISGNVDNNRIFYNRVPKCGSRGVLGTIRPLAGNLHYTFIESPIYSPHRLVNQSELAFIKQFMKYPQPLFYHRHLYFIDFQKYGYKPPIYINVIRDPYDRLISEFYFLKKVVRRKYPTQADRVSMTFDDCSKRLHRDCSNTRYTFKEVPFFCGQDPMCRIPSEAAVQRAKQNIARHYFTVGVTEKLAEFFILLQTQLPQFFKGAYEKFNENEKELHSRFRTSGRVSPKPESRAAIIDRLKYDYDLYKWVLQRFNAQYKLLSNNNNMTKLHDIS